MSENKKNLKLEILEKMSTLATAGFGLVAALAWNSAIQAFFKQINLFGEKDSITAKFIYAVVITFIIVLITFLIGRSINKIKEELGINPEEK